MRDVIHASPWLPCVYCSKTHKFHQTPNATPPFGNSTLHRRTCGTEKLAEISATSIDKTELINETHHSAFLSGTTTLFQHNSNVMQKGVLIGILILKPIQE